MAIINITHLLTKDEEKTKCDSCKCYNCVYDCDYCVTRNHKCGEKFICLRHKRR